MEPMDRAEMRQMFTDILSGHSEEMKGRFNVVDSHLEEIRIQTTRTNGRVTQAERDIERLKQIDLTHYINCPQVARIDKLEKSELTRKAIFRFIGSLWVATLAIIGVVIAIIELILKNTTV
jgi:hypothetical protein